MPSRPQEATRSWRAAGRFALRAIRMRFVAINVEIFERVAAGSTGFISASIHRSTDGTRVFSYLQWEAAEHLAAMQSSAEFRQFGRRFAGLIEFEPYRCESRRYALPADRLAVCDRWPPAPPTTRARCASSRPSR